MANYETLARPYAKAIFSVALADEQGLSQWSKALALLAAVFEQARVRSLIQWPMMGPQQKADQLIDLTDQKDNRQVCNLLYALADNGRLGIMFFIWRAFEALKDQHEATTQAEVVTAFSLQDDERDSLAKALERRFGGRVEMSLKVDKSLIGGAIIRAGDRVLDGSVRGRLEKLSRQLRRKGE